MSPTSADQATVRPALRAAGRVRVPGDKSISHRYAMLGALADGPSTIRGYLTGADCLSTLDCLRALGVTIRRTPGSHGDPGAQVEIGLGLRGLLAPRSPLDAGNPERPCACRRDRRRPTFRSVLEATDRSAGA